jgi:uncharacterized membrane protein (UPF0136 family)
MTVVQITLLVYAALMLVGGIIGFKKAGSRPSLIAGSVSGALLLGIWWLSRSDASLAAWCGAGLSVLLALSFTMRLKKTGKFMPSGGLLILSLVAGIILLLGALEVI